MTLWALIRALAGLVTVAVTVVTFLITRHLRGHPMGGEFAKWLPVEMAMHDATQLPQSVGNFPSIDPGMKLYEKAREQLAVGDLAGAGDRLRTIVSMYPKSESAGNARQIVTEINLDALLSPSIGEGKQMYKVRPGDSYLKIASQFDTSLDLLMYLNGLTSLDRLYPGDELIVMPLNFKLVLDPQRRLATLWDGERFLAEYQALKVEGTVTKTVQTQVIGKSGVQNEKHFQPSSSGYRGAKKVIDLKWSGWQIAALPEAKEKDEKDDFLRAAGMYLSAADMEELALLLRVGNEVEIKVD